MTNKPAGTSAEDAAALFGGGQSGVDPFARTEFSSIRRIKSVTMKAMPEDIMQRRRVPYDTAEFKSVFPNGYICLYVVSEGVDVFYEPDNETDEFIPLFNTRDGKMGEPAGRNSHAHIYLEAFQKVFGFRPIGSDNQAKAAGLVASWGQHLGDAAIEGQKVEWAWDIPRVRLPDNYEYTGEVRRQKPRGGAAGAPGGPVGMVELGGDALRDAIVTALTGLNPMQLTEAAQKINETPGLTDEWYNTARSGESVLQKAYDAGFIDLVDGLAAPKATEAAAKGKAKAPTMPVESV